MEKVRDSLVYTKAGEVLHCDTAGPFDRQMRGYTRLSVIVDEATGMVLLRSIHSVSEAAQHVMDVCEFVSNHSGRYPQTVQTDNGVEYVNDSTQNYLKSRGIANRRCVPYRHALAKWSC